MSRFNISVSQLNSQPNLDTNMEMCKKAVFEAAKNGSDLVALPENFAYMGNEWEKYLKGDRISDTVLQLIPLWAKESGIYIMAGGFPVRADSGKVYNRSIIVDPDGQIIAQYDKIHLFDVTLSIDEVYRESDTVESGKPEPVVCEISTTKNGEKHSLKIGLTVCYDLRFPELYRMLAEKGAELIFVPAAFTVPTGKAHWEVLLRSRAIENTLYIAAPAQTGLHGDKRKTYGHSMIIDPWGEVIENGNSDPGMIHAEIDTSKILQVRQKLPSLNHKVFSIKT